jgi:hypothetical protein
MAIAVGFCRFVGFRGVARVALGRGDLVSCMSQETSSR